MQYRILSLCIVSQLFFYYSWPFRPDRLLAIFALGWFAIAYFRGRTDRIKIKITELCMIAFTGLLGFSLVRGDVLSRSGVEQSVVILQALNISLFPFLFYFVAKHLRYSQQAVRSVSKCLLVIGLYLGLTAIFERFEITPLVWPSYIGDPGVGAHFGRSRGPLVNSVYLGLALVICIANILALWSASKDTFQRVILGASMLICMIGVYLTNTRGAWIGMGVALITICFFRVQARRMVAIALGVVMVSFVTIGASQFSLFGGNLFAKRQNTVVDREVNYAVALQMGMENPMLGIGWGRMGAEFNKYHRMIGSPEFGGWDGNHNEYLGIFAQAGIVALIVYAVILINLIYMMVSAYRHLPCSMEFERSLVVSALGCLLCYMTMAIFSDVHSSPLPNNLTFLFSGIAAGILSWSRSLTRSV